MTDVEQAEFKIVSRWDASRVLYVARGAADMKAAVEAAAREKANLYEADLCGANLRGANLGGADLRGANLYAANLGGADVRALVLALGVRIVDEEPADD